MLQARQLEANSARGGAPALHPRWPRSTKITELTRALRSRTPRGHYLRLYPSLHDRTDSRPYSSSYPLPRLLWLRGHATANTDRALGGCRVTPVSPLLHTPSPALCRFNGCPSGSRQIMILTAKYAECGSAPHPDATPAQTNRTNGRQQSQAAASHRDVQLQQDEAATPVGAFCGLAEAVQGTRPAVVGARCVASVVIPCGFLRDRRPWMWTWRSAALSLLFFPALCRPGAWRRRYQGLLLPQASGAHGLAAADETGHAAGRPQG